MGPSQHKANDKKSDIGLIGLAVMGENLALNMERNGSQVSVYNRAEGAEATVVERFLQGRWRWEELPWLHRNQALRREH